MLKKVKELLALAKGNPITNLKALLAWVDKQPNIVSAIGHGAICAVWMTFGLLLALLSKLGDETLALPIIIFFAGQCSGGYSLREGDDAQKAVGGPDEGEKLGQGFEDWIVPHVVTLIFALWYASLVA